MKLPLSAVERKAVRQGIIDKRKKQGPLLLCTDMPVTVKTRRYTSTLARMSIDELKYSWKPKEKLKCKEKLR